MSNPYSMTLQNLIEDMGHETRAYSGRAMYGKECLGVVTEDAERFFFDLGCAITEYNSSDAPQSIPTPRWRTDSMGCDCIIYFPSVAYVGDSNDDEE